MKKDYKLACFYNVELKMFHIWQTTQDKFKQNVTVTNALSPYAHLVHGVDYSVSSPTANDVDITDLTGAGLGNVRVTVIG